MNLNSKILVVDDDFNQLETFKNLLKIVGLEKVFCEPNGFAALDLLEKEKENIDLIITDFSMPGMNGLLLSSEIKQKYNIPIVMMSATLDEEKIEKGKEIGINGFWSKPLDLRDIKNIVSKFLK